MAFKRRLKPSAEFSSSSIADIVFLLLIFFLLTSQFVRQNVLEVELPKSEANAQAKSGRTVTIDAIGTYMWDDKEIGEGMTTEEKQELIAEEIKTYLADTTLESRVINLRSDTSVSYGTITKVIEAVTMAGGVVGFQTKE